MSSPLAMGIIFIARETSPGPLASQTSPKLPLPIFLISRYPETGESPLIIVLGNMDSLSRRVSPIASESVVRSQSIL